MHMARAISRRTRVFLRYPYPTPCGTAGSDAVGQGSQGGGGYGGDAQPYGGQPAAVTTRLSRSQVEDSLGRLFKGILFEHGIHHPILPVCLSCTVAIWNSGCAGIQPLQEWSQAPPLALSAGAMGSVSCKHDKAWARDCDALP